MADGKKTILTYIIVILVIFMVNLYGGYFIAQKILTHQYNTDDIDLLGEGESEEDDYVEGSGELGTMVTLDPINLNPRESSGEIFSCDIVLEVRTEDTEVNGEIGTRTPQIMDKLSNYLGMKTVSELADPRQWDQYRKEMTEVVNSVLTQGDISNLYIKQKIIQFE
ncbi:flagellar basal body-associated protein FliL [Candidatus Latescibacterota bacterium]